MPDKVLIKEKGYYVRVTSWENDADNYKTEELHVETEEEARFILDVCKLFITNPRNGGSDQDHFGNANYDRDEYSDQMLSAKLHSDVYGKYENLPEDYYDIDYVDECIVYELIGIWNDGCMMRVFESGNIYYYDEPVYAEKVA